MEHTDFYMMYKAIRDKEVVELKNALQKFPNHQYDWDENDEPRPRIVASPKHSDYTSDYEVCRITENLGYDCGIFIKDLESGEVVETGYAFLEFGSIDSLLDELPEIKSNKEKERSRRYGSVLYPTSFFLF